VPPDAEALTVLSATYESMNRHCRIRRVIIAVVLFKEVLFVSAKNVYHHNIAIKLLSIGGSNLCLGLSVCLSVYDNEFDI